MSTAVNRIRAHVGGHTSIFVLCEFLLSLGKVMYMTGSRLTSHPGVPETRREEKPEKRQKSLRQVEGSASLLS
ncbi:hypothetical protein RUM43_005862, partial [Polyplax serrata]